MACKGFGKIKMQAGSAFQVSRVVGAPRCAVLINGQIWPLSGRKRPAGCREKENTCGGSGALPFSISRARCRRTESSLSLSLADRRLHRAQRSGCAPENQNSIWRGH